MTRKKLIINKAIVLGGTKGIGASISNSIKPICRRTIICGRKQVDLSDISIFSISLITIKINQ